MTQVEHHGIQYQLGKKRRKKHLIHQGKTSYNIYIYIYMYITLAYIFSSYLFMKS